MVREMVGGCCVCLDDRGWDENPLVYCDGHGCNVAVHQACYGIVKVPSGPWFCCKCQSTERIARVKCELCPLKEGALKRTDTQGWAHVVCALYIPEVRFGNVSTMEPIILASVPHERYLKTCYICEENGKESKTSCGACMACNKPGCKLSFHVTCAQAKRLLCEESGHGNGNVQYVGYCATHWAKKPTSKNTADADSKKLNKKNRVRTESVSSNESVLYNKRGRKPNPSKPNAGISSPGESHSCSQNGAVSSSKGDVGNSSQAVDGSTATFHNPPSNSKPSNSQPRAPYPVSQVQFSVTDLISDESKQARKTEPKSEEVSKETKSRKEDHASSTKSDGVKSVDKTSLNAQKKRKLMEKVSGKIVKRQKLLKKEKDGKILKTKKKLIDAKKHTNKLKKSDAKAIPSSNQMDVYENGKLRPLLGDSNQLMCPTSFQDLLEFQWNQSAQFIIQKASHFDVASLLSTLHQLRSDNSKLERRLLDLTARRDRLLAANARLAVPLSLGAGETTPRSMSSMLPKLRENASDGSGPSLSGERSFSNGDLNSDAVAVNGYPPKNSSSLGSSPTENGSSTNEPQRLDSKGSAQTTPEKKGNPPSSLGSSGKGSKGSKAGNSNSGRKDKRKSSEDRSEDYVQQHVALNGHPLQSISQSGPVLNPLFSCSPDPSGLLQPGPSILGAPSAYLHHMLQQQRHSTSLHPPDRSMFGLLAQHPLAYSSLPHDSPINGTIPYSATESKVSTHKK